MQTEDLMRATTGDAARIRRYYDTRRAPVPAATARRDVLSLLEERKIVRRAAETLMMRALAYSGDPSVKEAVDELRAVLEDRLPGS